jgi:hypothetical protein
LKKLIGLGLAAALSSAAIAGHAAAAAPQEVVVDGTITSGKFAGANDIGDTYKEIFYVDVADLTYSNSGGIITDSGNAITAVSITVNGVTETFTPTSSFVTYSSTSGLTSWDMSASAGADATSIDLEDDASTGFADPFRNTVVLAVGGSSPVYSNGASYLQTSDKTNLGLNPTSVFPEPPTWGLMIGGVALAGLLLRRKRESDMVIGPAIG